MQRVFDFERAAMAAELAKQGWSRRIQRMVLALWQWGRDHAQDVSVDTHGSWTLAPSIPALAATAGLCTKTIKRALADLVDAVQWIEIEHSDCCAHTFQIAWNALFEVNTGCGGQGGHQGGTGGTFDPGTGGTFDPGDPPRSLYPPSKNDLIDNYQFNQPEEEAGALGWPPATIRAGDLRIPETVERLFLAAVAAGIARDCDADRTGFHALAARALARGKDPPALFVLMVKRRQWREAAGVTCAEEDAARRSKRPPRVAMPAVDEFDMGAAREEQLAKLAARFGGK